MIIDFHTHIFPEKMAAATIAQLESVSGTKAATNGCLDGLLTSMEEAGVDCSVSGGCYFLGGFGRLFDSPQIYSESGAIVYLYLQCCRICRMF